MRATVSHVIRLWMEVSARVLCHQLIVAGFPAKAETLVAEGIADWKKWSAVWRGIESGITKFCAEVDLTGDQLLVLGEGRSAAVELARGMLHGTVELTRFRGHCSPMGGGVHDAEESTAVPAGVPAADH
jgi:hypothetical protein